MRTDCSNTQVAPATIAFFLVTTCNSAHWKISNAALACRWCPRHLKLTCFGDSTMTLANPMVSPSGLQCLVPSCHVQMRYGKGVQLSAAAAQSLCPVQIWS